MSLDVPNPVEVEASENIGEFDPNKYFESIIEEKNKGRGKRRDMIRMPRLGENMSTAIQDIAQNKPEIIDRFLRENIGFTDENLIQESINDLRNGKSNLLENEQY